jgi:hypothetical protein
MQPNQQPNPTQPAPTPQSGAPNSQYEFMMAPSSQPKKSMGLPMPKGKIPIIIGVLLGIIVLVSILSLVMSGGGDEATTQLASLSAEQQEIIRISDVTLKLSKDSTTLATATTVKSSLTSEQKTALELYASLGGKLAKGQLNTKLSKKTEEALNSAAQSNTLNKAYEEYLQASLATYQKNLKALYAIGGPKTKVFAEEAYNSSKLVLDSI